MGIDLDNIFIYHRPNQEQADRYTAIRSAGRDLAEHIIQLTPSSAEQTLALRKVQEAVMWANASIALNEK